jgi:GR25 family glycosyltransferase involved in LPS biosynthesis
MIQSSASYKAFVIHKEDQEISSKLAQACVNTGKKFGIHVEKVNGLYQQTAQEFLAHHNLRPYLENGKETLLTKQFPRKGVLASHYMMWLKCAELDEPIIILEHDAFFVRPLPEVHGKFTDFLSLDPHTNDPTQDTAESRATFIMNPKLYGEKVMKDGPQTIERFYGYGNYTDEINFEQLRNRFIRGSHGYIITPDACKKLFKVIEEIGYVTSDVQLNSLFIEMYILQPNVVRVNDFFCNTFNHQRYSHCSTTV